MPKERKPGRGGWMVKGEGVSMPRLSSIERKLQTTGTSSSFDETGISTSLFKLQTADNPCSRPQKWANSVHSHNPIPRLSGKPFSSIKSLDSLSSVTGLWAYPHFKALNSPRKGQERLDPPRGIWVEFEGWVRGHLAQLGSVSQPGNQRNG